MIFKNTIKSYVVIIFVFLYSFGLLISSLYIPVKRLFSYYSIGTNFHVPYLLGSLSNFDGNHYVRIAQYSYGQYQQAFFPFYSILIKYVGILFGGNYIYSGAVISIICFLLICKLWPKTFATLKQDSSVFWLLIYPTSFFFATIYTESLFVFLLLQYIYYLQKNNYYVFIVGFLLGLTRFNGSFVIIFPLIYILANFVKQNELTLAHVKKYIPALLSPILGLVTYMCYLYYTKGNMLEFIDAQKGFNNGRSTHIVLLPQVLWRYIKILLYAKDPLLLSVSVFEFVTFLLALYLICFGMYKLVKANYKKLSTINNIDVFYFAILSYSLVNLILPTLTGTLSSIPRYILLCPAVFFELSKIKNKFIKAVLITIFVLLNIAAHALFTSAYFVS